MLKLPEIFIRHICSIREASMDTAHNTPMIPSDLKVVNFDEVKEEYGIKVTGDEAVLNKQYQIVVIGTNHKIFNNIDMSKILTDKGFICDIYGIHKART